MPCMTYIPGHKSNNSNNTSHHENKNGSGNQFTAYPNPTNSMITFAYNVPDAGGDVRILVTNIVGETVRELHTGNNTGTINWDAGRMAAGVYIYKATSNKGVVSQGKLVVIN